MSLNCVGDTNQGCIYLTPPPPGKGKNISHIIWVKKYEKVEEKKEKNGKEKGRVAEPEPERTVFIWGNRNRIQNTVPDTKI
jgi:hypothetical protein